MRRPIMRTLDLRMQGADMTVREWLSEAMVALIKEADGFSGKRPLGNSDWWWDMIDAVVDAGLAERSGEAEQLLLDDVRALMDKAEDPS